MRFIPFTAGSGILSIKDTKNNRIVCAFFRDKGNPEASDRMADVCLKALNDAVTKTSKESSNHA